MLSRHFGPSSRILAGPVSGEIDLSCCDLSYSFYYFLSILILLFIRSVCSVVLYVVPTLWSSSGTVVSSFKSSMLETPLGAYLLSPSDWRHSSPSSLEALQSFKSSALETPLEAFHSSPSSLGALHSIKSSTSVAPLEAEHLNPLSERYSIQVLHLEAFKSSTFDTTLEAAHSTPFVKECLTQALQLEAAKSSSQEAVLPTLPISLQQRNLYHLNQLSFLDHRRRSDPDLATSNRASFTSTSLIQAFDRIKAPSTTTSSEDVDTLLSNIHHPENNLLHSLGKSQAPAAEDFCQTTGNSTTLSFTNALPATRELGEQLLYLTSLQYGLANFHSQLDANSTNKRVSELPDLLCLLTSLRDQWQTANHPFKSKLNSCLRWLNNLATDASATEASPTEDKSDTHPTPDSTSFSSPPAFCFILGNYNSTFDLPKLTGDILNWNTFCIFYKEINHTRGLDCLKEFYKHSHHQLLLCSTTGILNLCLKVVAEINNKTQKLYDLLCTTLLNLPGFNNTRTHLSRLVDLFKRTISSLKPTNHFYRDSFLSSLVCSILPFKQQAAWAQHTAEETAVPALSQTIFVLTNSTETLPASGAPSSVNSFDRTPLKNSTKTDKNQQSQLKQRSHDYSASTPSHSSNFVIFKLERHSVHFCPRKQNLTLKQNRRPSPSSNLRHNSEGAAPTVHSYSILNHPQQLPDALLWKLQFLLQSSGGQQLKARAYINQNAGLSLLSTTTAQALKLTLETITTLLTVQGIDCKDSQHSNSIFILLHIKLNIQGRPAVRQAVILNILSQQLYPVDDYLHLLDLQPATNIFIIPGRVNISLGADIYLHPQEELTSIMTPDVNPGAPNIIPGCANTGTTKALVTHQQRNNACTLLSNSSKPTHPLISAWQTQQ